MMLGFGMAAIGMDTVSGQLRMTFGWSELLRGIDFLIAVIGLFGIGEILLTMEEGLAFKGKNAKMNLRGGPASVGQGLAALLGDAAAHLRSSAAGWASRPAARPPPRSWVTASPSAFPRMATSSARADRRRDRPGNRGACVRHLRAAADARAGHPRFRHRRGAAGRPDDLGPAARAAAVRRAEGFCVGPDRQHVPGQHCRADRRALHRAAVRGDPAHSVFHHRTGHHRGLCAIGAYTVHSAMLDIWFMVLFGVVGYVLKKLDYPLAPLVLSLVLGDRAEDAFRQTMLGFEGNSGRSSGRTGWSAPSRPWRSSCCSGR